MLITIWVYACTKQKNTKNAFRPANKLSSLMKITWKSITDLPWPTKKLAISIKHLSMLHLFVRKAKTKLNPMSTNKCRLYPKTPKKRSCTPTLFLSKRNSKYFMKVSRTKNLLTIENRNIFKDINGRTYKKISIQKKFHRL